MPQIHDAGSYELQLQDKVASLESLMQPLQAPGIEVFASPPIHYRMRAEFRVWHDSDDLYHIMFDSDSKKPYRVDAFPPASKVINAVMHEVITRLKVSPVLRKKLFQVDYLSGLSEEVVVSLLYHKQLDKKWEEEASLLLMELQKSFAISIIGRARKQKVVLGQDYIVEKLPIEGKTYHFQHIENSFTQPNAYVNISMIQWAKSCAKQLSGDLLEFYCGAGNFSLPLADEFRYVVGTEIAKPSVAAAQFSIAANQIDNASIVRLSAEEFVQALAGVRVFNRLQGINLAQYDFKTVLVDPPRAGLDEETLQCVQAFDNILYISCNPHTLTDNLATLTKTHYISRVALFDQFPFTHHIESGVFLTRK